jgi:hypothetical protein
MPVAPSMVSASTWAINSTTRAVLRARRKPGFGVSGRKLAE